MIDAATLTSLLGWCTLLNLVLYGLSAVALSVLRGPTMRLHRRCFGPPEADLPRLYFQFLGNYKIAILVFNLVPYCALRLMGY